MLAKGLVQEGQGQHWVKASRLNAWVGAFGARSTPCLCAMRCSRGPALCHHQAPVHRDPQIPIGVLVALPGVSFYTVSSSRGGKKRLQHAVERPRFEGLRRLQARLDNLACWLPVSDLLSDDAYKIQSRFTHHLHACISIYKS